MKTKPTRRSWLWKVQYFINRKISKFTFSKKLVLTLEYLQANGVSIDVIYDIGARHGDWSINIQRAFPAAEFILFEANPKCEPFLAGTGWPYFIAVLSSEAKRLDFYENNSTGDSYYKEDTSHYESVVPTEKQAVTLDQMIESNQLKQPDFIKLDTQGSELDILRGGKTALSNASLVYMECPIVAYNKGAPNIHDYIAFMAAEGFVPHDICEIHRAHQTLLQIDLLFIRKTVLSRLVPTAAQILKFVA